MTTTEYYTNINTNQDGKGSMEIKGTMSMARQQKEIESCRYHLQIPHYICHETPVIQKIYHRKTRTIMIDTDGTRGLRLLQLGW